MAVDPLDDYIDAVSKALALPVEEAWKPAVRANLEVSLKLMPSTARNCSGSTGGLRENNFVSVAVAPWRGYSFTSFSTTRRGGFSLSPPEGRGLG